MKKWKQYEVEKQVLNQIWVPRHSLQVLYGISDYIPLISMSGHWIWAYDAQYFTFLYVILSAK